jgi:hypothetical protein
MEDIEIYGKDTKDIPDLNTLRSFEKRKNYILEKLDSKIEKESYYNYLIEEIRALEKTMNFIKYIQNNLENDMLKEIIKKYEMENEKSIYEENEDEDIDNIKEVVYGIIDEKQGRNHKYEVILSRDNGINYISITSQRRKKNNVSWKKTREIKMTINKMEKILRIAKEKEIESDKNKINCAKIYDEV